MSLFITNPQAILDSLFGARDGETFFRVAKAVEYQLEWPALSSTLWTHRSARIVPTSGGITTEIEAKFGDTAVDTDAQGVSSSMWDSTDADELGSVAVELPRVDGETLLPVVKQYRADIHAVGELLRKDTQRATFFPPLRSLYDAAKLVVEYKSSDTVAKENAATLAAEATQILLSSPAVIKMEADRKARKVARAEAYNARVGTAESAAALAKALVTDEEKAEQALIAIQNEVQYVVDAFNSTHAAVLDDDMWDSMPLWFQHRIGTAVYDVLASKLAGINGQRMMQRANESEKSFAAREAARDNLVTMCAALAEQLTTEATNWEVVADTSRRAK